jgi:hypothetical protein
MLSYSYHTHTDTQRWWRSFPSSSMIVYPISVWIRRYAYAPQIK